MIVGWCGGVRLSWGERCLCFLCLGDLAFSGELDKSMVVSLLVVVCCIEWKGICDWLVRSRVFRLRLVGGGGGIGGALGVVPPPPPPRPIIPLHPCLE